MNKNYRSSISYNKIMVVLWMIFATAVLPACSTAGLAAGAFHGMSHAARPVSQVSSMPASLPQTGAPSGASTALIQTTTDYQATLERIYQQVNPSVVNIQVAVPQTVSQNSPFFFPAPGQQGDSQAPLDHSYGLGSGFVWDNQGHIVTNNHVVEGADKVQVLFSDGTILNAKVVGTDAYSDLAVIQVEGARPDLLKPVTLANSNQVKVGQLAIAIGSPFGQQGTMTVGIVSAVGRSLPVGLDSPTSAGPSYTIPDVI